MSDRRHKTSVVIFLHVQLVACATPFNVADPAQGMPVSKVLKSIKCEMITFLEVNRQQRELFGKNYRARNADTYKYPYLDIADDLFAGIYVQLKEVDIKSLDVGFNRISRLTTSKSLTYLAGPAVSSTDTFEVNQNFALLQSAKLHVQPEDDVVRRSHGPSPAGFDCYGNLSRRESIDFERVSNNEYGSDFERIRVGYDQTLSQWLQKLTAEMSENYLANVDNLEVIAPGQISYAFTLDYNLSVDGKYVLVAQLWNPLSVAPTASTDRLSMFKFVFNTNYAPIAFGANSGAVGSKTAPCLATRKFIDPNCKLSPTHGQRYLKQFDRSPAVSGPISPRHDERTRFDLKNNPDVFYTLPLGLPLLAPSR